MKIISNPLPNIYVLKYFDFEDERGRFLKPFSQNNIVDLPIDFNISEAFYSHSHKNVIRGMHFQHSRFSQSKLIYCTNGAIKDIIVDVRRDSINFNKPFSINLSYDLPYALFVGPGYAHGFTSLTNISTVHYLVDTPHNTFFDAGFLWSSIAYDWQISEPVVSHRDNQFPSIQESTFTCADFE